MSGFLCRVVRVTMTGIVVAVGMAPSLGAQNPGEMRGPRFLVASASAPSGIAPLEVNRTPALRQRITLDLDRVTIKQALTAIARAASLNIAYAEDILPVHSPISLRADRITVAAALTDVLVDANVDIVFTSDNQAVLQSRIGAQALQAGTVVGRVTDVKTNLPLNNAEVLLEKTRWRATTDTGGRYRLTDVAPGNYTLTVRRFGYTKQSRSVTVRADQADTADIGLEPVATRLNELVSTATGQRRRVDIANDITTINADSVMQTAPIRSVTDLLENRVPGLTVQRTSGAPGDPARLRLRGPGSALLNNDPIIIVDGVRAYSDQSSRRSLNLATAGSDTANNSFAHAYATPSPLDYIDPSMIEKIEVVKGPSAATLYGPDAANGVILITTKRGQAGPTQWVGTFEQGRTILPGDFPNVWVRWGHRSQQDGVVWCPVGDTIAGFTGINTLPVPCSADSVVQYQLLNDQRFTPLKSARRSKASVGASGGSGVLTYSVTGTFQHDVGLPQLPQYEVDRYVSLLGTQPPDWMYRPQHNNTWGISAAFRAKLGAKADLTLTTNIGRNEQQRSSLETNLGTLQGIYVDPASGLYYTSDNLRQAPLSGVATTESFLTNYYQRVTDKATSLRQSVALNWHPWSWFNVDGDGGLDLVHRADESYVPADIQALVGRDTSQLNSADGNSLVTTVNLRGSGTRPIGHGFNAQFALGVNYQGTSIRDQTLTSQHLAVGTSNIGSSVGGTRETVETATFGWYVAPSIGNQRINFSLGLRLDGSTALGGSVGGFHLPSFPKLGFSYLVSDEPWFPFKSVFQSLRLRTSYGKASRQPGLGQKLRTFSAPKSQYVDGEFNDLVYLSSLGNTELRPERTGEFEGGFDADLLDSRVTLSVSGYRKTTHDMIMSKALPPSVYGGVTQLYFNISEVRNTGMSLEGSARLLRSRTISWDTHVRMWWDRNVVVSLGNGVQPFYQGAGFTGYVQPGDYDTRVAEGYPLFGTWAITAVGYAEVNGQATIIYGDTAVYVGQPYPNYQAAFGTDLTFLRGAVRVSAEFEYENGLGQINGVGPGVMSRALNDTTLRGTGLTLSELGSKPSQTVDLLRFKSLGVVYQVPASLARRLGAQDLSLGILGSNLGLSTNYSGLDPNVNGFPVGNRVVDSGVLPQPRVWEFRVNVRY